MNRNDLINKLFQKEEFLSLKNPHYKKITDALFDWMIECDQIGKDQTSKLLKNEKTSANIICKQDMIIAGMEEVGYFLKRYANISFSKKANDGDPVKKGQLIGVIMGDNKTIFAVERTILNILQRMSGIATQTRFFADKLKPVRVAATRKTPWMLIDKKAVAVGGGLTHRLDLADGILIKDNHLESIAADFKLKTEAEAVSKALSLVLGELNKTTIEIEVNTEAGANAAIETFVNFKLPVIARSPEATEAIPSKSKKSISEPDNNYLIIMFDNWSPKTVKGFLDKNKKPDSILFEASGNINGNNLDEWAGSEADVVSSGALTHSTRAADISLEVK